jgi:hypothetical protein
VKAIDSSIEVPPACTLLTIIPPKLCTTNIIGRSIDYFPSISHPAAISRYIISFTLDGFRLPQGSDMRLRTWSQRYWQLTAELLGFWHRSPSKRYGNWGYRAAGGRGASGRHCVQSLFLGAAAEAMDGDDAGRRRG